MATLVVAVGIGVDGEYHNLYTGPSYADAQTAMVEAGQRGQISMGEILNNPMPVVRQFYQLRTEAEPIADNAIKRPRGRPRKYPLVIEPSPTEPAEYVGAG